MPKLPINRAIKRERSPGGNMLALVAGVTATVLIAFLLFALGYIRLLGGSNEQRTAIEAAALSAASDISKIVYNDPNFGYLSVSDYAPVGTGTKAGDNFFMPVRSINTLLATIRVDMIIADRLNSPVMRQLSQRDYQNAMTAKDNLVAEIQSSLTTGGGGTAKDKDGNTINTYTNAENAYKTNVIRMTGKSNYVAGSLRLQLGCLEGGAPTNTPVPKPASAANVSGTQAQNGFYMSYVNVPYNGRDFVFAGVSNNIKLVSPSNWVATASGVPYSIPTIIKAEADQRFSEGAGASAPTRVVRSTACAQPANAHDPLPAPGALSISFPDDRIPQIDNPGQLMTLPNFNGPPMLLQTPTGGDCPGAGTLNPLPSPTGGPLTFSGMWQAGLYDWLKNAGSKPNVSSAQNLFGATFNQTIPAINGQMEVYTFNMDGTIKYILIPTGPMPFMPASHNQAYTSLFDAMFTPGGEGIDPGMFDAYIKDYSLVQGTINGGIHGGQPMPNPQLTAVVPVATYMITQAPTRPSFIASIGGVKGFASGGDCGGGGSGAGNGYGSSNPPAWTGPQGGPPNVLDSNDNDNDNDNDADLDDVNRSATGTFGARNDLGLGVATAVVSNYAPGPAGGAKRVTYVKDGSVCDVRFRRQYQLTRGGPIQYKLTP